MKLAVFNGSPRGLKSNTKLLLDHFLKGFSETAQHPFEMYYLKPDDIKTNTIHFQNAENIIIAFPMYLDCMPAIVKEFFESLADCDMINSNNKSMGFVIQSGFPEPGQFYYLEKYLKNFTNKLNINYKGTVIRGSGEGIQVDKTAKGAFLRTIHFVGRKTNLAGVGYFLNTKRLFKLFYLLGKHYGMTTEFKTSIKDILAKPKKLSGVGFKMFTFISSKLYFNVMLRKYQAYNKRYDMPYFSK